MKSVLLKALRINGVSVARAESGPTIVDVPDAEYEGLVERGVVRPVERADLALAEIEDAVIVEPEPKPEPEPAPEPTKKPGKAAKPGADDDL